MLLSLDDAAELCASWSSIHTIGTSATPLVAIDFRDHAERQATPGPLEAALIAPPWVTIGVVDASLPRSLHGVVERCDIVLFDRARPGANSEGAASATPVDTELSSYAVMVDDAGAEVDRLAARISASPDASVALVQLLRLSHDRSVEAALHAESVTYGLLQSSVVFDTWLQQRRVAASSASRGATGPTSTTGPGDGPVVDVERVDGLLKLALRRPLKRNALNIAMRDELTEALEVLLHDASLDGALLRGAGPNFCAGGDLDEFGTTPSPAIGHHVRSVRSLPRLVHQVRDRLRVHLHGSCVGAGIELPAFTTTVIAHPDTTFRLPEIGFGLVPGAGGTVSITRRCGRHRTAWWAISGDALDTDTARRWHLIDRVDATIPIDD